MTTERFKVVRFTQPQEFLQTVKDYDDSFFNLTIGSLLDSLDEVQMRLRNLDPDPATRIILGVYEEDALVAALSRVKDDFVWQLNSLRDPWNMDDAFITGVATTLTQYLANTSLPIPIDYIFGPDKLTETFVATYAAHIESQGTRVTFRPPIFVCKLCFATKSTLTPAPPSLSPAPCTVQLGNVEDLDVITALYYEFGVSIGDEHPLDYCREQMHRWLEAGLIYVCRVGDGIAAYSTIGRSTPRTIAVRNVYVSPKHRRKGVAETMVRFLTRYFLGVPFEGAPDVPPRQGIKEEMCLNVIEEDVARLYKRVGFLLGDDDRDPVSGKRGWLATAYYGIKNVD